MSSGTCKACNNTRCATCSSWSNCTKNCNSGKKINIYILINKTIFFNIYVIIKDVLPVILLELVLLVLLENIYPVVNAILVIIQSVLPVLLGVTVLKVVTLVTNYILNLFHI